MKNIIYIANKQNKRKFLKEIKNESFKSNLIFIEDAYKNKIFEKIHLADALIHCPRRYVDKILLINPLLRREFYSSKVNEKIETE